MNTSGVEQRLITGMGEIYLCVAHTQRAGLVG
jgi:hypothetical protein